MTKESKQLNEGRVFELRSKSKTYPPPCALVINAADGFSDRRVVEVDRLGVVGTGLYHRRSNPDFYIEGMQLQEIEKRAVRRRRDLERFDMFDLAAIRYGYTLDFDGRMDSYDMPSIPVIVPTKWTIFWTPPMDEHDWYYSPKNIRKLMHGAWWFEHHGGSRHLGYKYGHVWATRHTGSRLDTIRRELRRFRGDLIEQESQVVRWNDGERVFTSELRRECPVFGSGRGWTSIHDMNGAYQGGFC